MQTDMNQLKSNSEFLRKETEMVQQSPEFESQNETDTKFVQQFHQPNDIPLNQIETEDDNYVNIRGRTILDASSQSESLLLCEQGETSFPKDEELHCNPLTDCYVWNGEVIPLGNTADMTQTVEKEQLSEQMHSDKSINKNNDSADNRMEQFTQFVKPVKQSSKQVVQKVMPSKSCGTSKSPKMCCNSTRLSAANCQKANVSDSIKLIDNAAENIPSNSLAQKAIKPFRKKAKKKMTPIDKAVDCFYKEISNMPSHIEVSHIEVLPPSKSIKSSASAVRAIVSNENNDSDQNESSDKPNFVLSSVGRIVQYDDDEDDENSVDDSNLSREMKITSLSNVKVCSLAETEDCRASRVNEYKNPSAENNTVYGIVSSHSAMFSPKEIGTFKLKNDQQKAITETHLDKKDSSVSSKGSTDRPESVDISESDYQLLSNISQGQKQSCTSDFSKRYALHETDESGNRIVLMDKYLDTSKYSDSHVTISSVDASQQVEVNRKNENPIALPISVSDEKNYESCELLIQSVDHLKSVADTLGSLSAVQNYINEDSNSSCASIKEEKETVFEKNCNNTSLSENAFTFANKINDVSSDTVKKTTVQIDKGLICTFPEVHLNPSENKKTVECSSTISVIDYSVIDTKVLLESHLHLTAMTRCLDDGSESLGIENSSAVECASSSYSSVNPRNYKICFRSNTLDGQQSDDQNKTVGVYSTANGLSVLTAENVSSQANSGCYLDGTKDNEQSIKNSQDRLHCFEIGMHNISLDYEDPSGFTGFDSDSTTTALTSGHENASSTTKQSSFTMLSSAYDEGTDECCRLSVNIGQGKNTCSDTNDLQDSLAALKDYLNDDSDSPDSDLEENVNTDIESSSKKPLSDIPFDITKNKNDSLIESSVNLVDSCTNGMISSYLNCKWIEEDIVSPDNSNTGSIHDTSCSSHATVKAVSDCDELYTSEVVEPLQPLLKYSEGRNSDVNIDAKSSYSISIKGKQSSVGIIDYSEYSDSSSVLDCSLYDSPVSNISKLSLSKLEKRKKRLTKSLVKHDLESSLKPDYVFSELDDSKDNSEVSQKLADIRYWIQQAEEESIIIRKRLSDKLQQGWDSPCSEDEDSDVAQLQAKEFSIRGSFSNSNEDLKLLNKLTDSSSVKSNSSLQHAGTAYSICRHKMPDCTEEMDRLTRSEQVTESLRKRSRSVYKTSNSDSRNEDLLSVIGRTWKRDHQRSSSNETQSTWRSRRARSRSRVSGQISRSKSKDTWSSVSSDRGRAESNCSYLPSRESSQLRNFKQSDRRTRKRPRSCTNTHQEISSRESSSSRKRSRSNSNRKRSWSSHSNRRRIRQLFRSRDNGHKGLIKLKEVPEEVGPSRSSPLLEPFGFETSKNEVFTSNPRRDKPINMDVRQCSTREKVVILHSAALACETFGMYRAVFPFKPGEPREGNLKKCRPRLDATKCAI